MESENRKRDQNREAGMSFHLGSFICTIPVVWFPVCFIFFKNAETVAFSQVLPLLGYFLAAAGVLYTLFTLYIRSHSGASFCTILACFLFEYFAFIEKGLLIAFPRIQYWHVLYLCIVALVCAAMAVKKKMPSAISGAACKIVGIVFSGLLLFNFVMAIPKLISHTKEPPQKEALNYTGNGTSEGSGNNIYMLIFDEYAGYEQLKALGYDNSAFYETLREQGFNVSLNSHGYTQFSKFELPNILNLSAVSSLNMEDDELAELLNNPNIFSLMKQHGYSINMLCESAETIKADDCKYEYAANVSSRTMQPQYYIIRNTVLYPCYEQLYKADSRNAQDLLDKAEYIGNAAKLQPDHLFTFAYFMAPHDPFIVDENGNLQSIEKQGKRDEPSVYLSYLKYINKIILSITDKIVKEDPNAVVILLSDHGFRDDELLMLKRPITMNDTNVLVAVYFRGEAVDVTGLSPIQVSCRILNKALATGIPELADDEIRRAMDIVNDGGIK